MVQRVQLAAAMVHEPDVLVLDEPYAGLDPNAVQFLSAVVLDHAAAGHHVVLSSHQLDLVEDVCEEIFMLHRGRIVLAGAVADLKAESPDRYLRVDAGVAPDWLAGTDAMVIERTPAGSRIRLDVGADAATVLDRVRDRAPVHDFGVEAPSLSELFLAAAGDHAAADLVTAGAAVRPDGRAVRLVIGREVREALRRKAVWVAAALALLATGALVIVPSLVSSDDARTVVVVGTARSDVGGRTARGRGRGRTRRAGRIRRRRRCGAPRGARPPTRTSRFSRRNRWRSSPATPTTASVAVARQALTVQHQTARLGPTASTERASPPRCDRPASISRRSTPIVTPGSASPPSRRSPCTCSSSW